MIAALKRKWNELMQVINLHSALSRSNMQIHNLRKAGDGRYLVRVSVSPRGTSGIHKVALGSTSPFEGAGLIAKVSGNRERMANENKFAEYFNEAMSNEAFASGTDANDDSDMSMSMLSAADGNDTIEVYGNSGAELAVYTDFGLDRKITTKRAADWGLRAMLRSFGCDVDDAEMVSDAGYGSQWIAVAFAAA